MSDAAPQAEVLTRFDRFELRDVLGSGAMGTVYRAYDPRLDALVALKVLSVPLHAFPEPERREVIARFEREARVLSELEHPGIVRVIEAGAAGGTPYTALELVDGEDLAAFLGRRDSEPELLRRAVGIVADAADAIEAAHAQGVVHRDIKPANILIESVGGRARVTDFGLAGELAPGSRLTKDGQSLGTPEYMAPEQARGDRRAIGALTDVYGLGATLYEALTGRPPFTGSTPWRVAQAVLTESLVRPRELEQDIPPALEAIVVRALAREPELRFPSAGTLAAALRGWLADEATGESSRRLRGPTAGYLVRLFLRRHKIVATTVGFSLLAALVTAGIFLQELRRQRSHAEQRAEIARRSLDTLVYRVEEELVDVPGQRAREAREHLLATALDGLAELSALERREPITRTAAEAHLQVGELARTVGRNAEARAAFDEALRVARAVLEEEPEDHGAQVVELEALGELATLHVELGDLGGVEATAREAERLVRAHREDHAGCAEAPQVLIEALRARGHAVRRQRRYDEAVGALDEALGMARSWLASAPGDVARTQALVTILDEQALLRVDRADLGGALAARREAVGLSRALAEADPRSLRARSDLALMLGSLGSLQLMRGEPGDARASLEESLQLSQDMVREDPTNPKVAQVLASCEALLGQLGDSR